MKTKHKDGIGDSPLRRYANETGCRIEPLQKVVCLEDNHCLYCDLFTDVVYDPGVE